VGSLRLVAERRWARWLAPAVFLLAVTGVVLVVRSALHSDTSATPPATRHVTTSARVRKAPLLAPPAARVPAQYYVIQSGDTLDAIAARFATTVDQLLALNEGVEPTTLHPGERLRIK
jgi:LysM repeat protein